MKKKFEDDATAKGIKKKGKGGSKKKGRQNKFDSTNKVENGSPDSVVRREFDGNHPEWYEINEQLTKDVASLPFTYALGTRFNFGETPYTNYSLPGVARLNYAYTYGFSTDNTSPLNLATRNIYSFLKSVNSRAKTYDANDLGVYIMCIDQAHAYYEFMKRLYGVLNTTNVMNRYAPRAIVEACGGDYDDLLGNVVQLREYINTYVVRLSTMPMPGSFTIFERHSWLNRHVWVDSNDTLKSQNYVFTPISYGVFDIDDDGAGYMHAKLLPFAATERNSLTFAQIKTIGEEILSAILYGAGEEDFNIIGGDILYAYGKESVKIPEMVAENYSVLPQYNLRVLNQIHNARFYGVGSDESLFEEHFSITQSEGKNYLITKPSHNLRYEFEAAVDTADPMFPDLTMPQPLDLNTLDSSAKEILVATRLMTIPNIYQTLDDMDMGTAINVTMEYTDCASEIGQSMVIYYYATDTGLAADWRLHQTPAIVSYVRMRSEADFPIMQANAIIEQWNRFAMLECFDQHPLLFPAFLDRQYPNMAVVTTHNWIGDMNNNTYLTHNELNAINNIALMAMFGVDKVGNVDKA